MTPTALRVIMERFTTLVLFSVSAKQLDHLL